jgi:hypothetical protein
MVSNFKCQTFPFPSEQLLLVTSMFTASNTSITFFETATTALAETTGATAAIATAAVRAIATDLQQKKLQQQCKSQQ